MRAFLTCKIQYYLTHPLDAVHVLIFKVIHITLSEKIFAFSQRNFFFKIILIKPSINIEQI